MEINLPPKTIEDSSERPSNRWKLFSKNFHLGLYKRNIKIFSGDLRL